VQTDIGDGLRPTFNPFRVTRLKGAQPAASVSAFNDWLQIQVPAIAASST